ncbi:MAG: nucleotidyltransferase family protein [Clostridia bacterium]|nr:nucleotidyltransferase family protein [Clostridia bacterium]
MDINILDVMFKLIRSAVCCEEKFTDIDKETIQSKIESLYDLSKKHDVQHLVGYALFKNRLINTENPYYSKFQKQQIVAVYRYERIQYELNEICAALEQLKIPFIPLKGSVIRAYYPEPWMRTSCDIDILVDKKDLDVAVNHLVSALGYREDGRGSHDVSLFAPGEVHLELHYELLEDWRAEFSRNLLRDVWKVALNKDGFNYHKVLPDEYFYLYHIAHMAKHFYNGGCGIRSFLDLWILNHKVNHDDEKRKTLLQSASLDKFSFAAENLSEVWFLNKQPDETCVLMQEYVLTGGVYGNNQNRITLQQTKKGGKFKYAMSRIFLPYDVIKFHYPVLQKHRWLLPFCQVRRWFKLLFCGGAKRSFNELKINQNLSNAEKTKAEELIEKLGL